jgi:hypothetical protein
MFAELVIIIVVCFFIAILFYKQANESFEILQVNSKQMDELPTYYAEHSPIVVKDFALPNLGTLADLEKRPQIMNLSVGVNLSLKALIQSEGSIKAYTWNQQQADFLAKESGLKTWWDLQLFPTLLPSPYTKWLYSSKSSLWVYTRGLFKTKAFQTVLMPTQGVAKVSIMLATAEPYLPTDWKGRKFASLTLNDTPLLNQIKFIEIRLKRGHLLFLPAHMIVDIASEKSDPSEQAWVFCGEIHHPISRIAN